MTLAWPLLSLGRWTASGPISILLLLVPVSARSETPPAPSPEEMQTLIHQLGDERFPIRENASVRLLEIGPAALPLLERAAESKDPEVRQRAWQILDQHASEGNVPALLFQLSSQSAPIRAGAAESLGKMEAKAQPALPGLIKAVADPMEFVRCSAQEALKKVQATLPLRLDLKQNVEAIELDATTVYRIDISNQGKSAATKVRLQAVVPDQLTVISLEGQLQLTQQGKQLSSESMTLEADESRYCEVHVKTKAPGTVRFQVELIADDLMAPIVGEVSTTITPPNPQGN
jgi:uncharacterized repeat protein (TIGR01451 family)